MIYGLPDTVSKVHQVHIADAFQSFTASSSRIERVWGQAKKYSWGHTKLICKHFQGVREYERPYLQGKLAGKELEQALKVPCPTVVYFFSLKLNFIVQRIAKICSVNCKIRSLNCKVRSVNCTHTHLNSIVL